MPTRRIKLTCPYCKNEFTQYLDLDECVKHDHVELIYCDQDDSPGCGKQFAIAPEIEIRISVFTLQEIVNEPRA